MSVDLKMVKRHGQGTGIDPDGTLSFEGIFENGEFKGKK